MLARALLRSQTYGNAPPPTLTTYELDESPEGGWTWFIDPRAVAYGSRTYWGYINRDGDVTARNTVNATRVTDPQEPEDRLFPAFQIDDHDNPSLLIRESDHRLMAWNSGHSGNNIAQWVSVTSLDSDPGVEDGFEPRVGLDTQLGGGSYTYPTPHQLISETDDPIYLFYRDPIDGSTTAMRYSISTDDGDTWAAQTTLFAASGRSAYWKIVGNGTDRIDFAVSDGHPMYDANVSIYHFYYTGGNVYKTDGTLIGALGASVLEPADVTLVYSGATTTSWVWDVALIGGIPYIAFTTYPGNDGSDHRANYARWTGSAWDTNEVDSIGTYVPTAIASGGSQLEVFYSGGIVLDQVTPGYVYYSKGLGADRWDIYRGVTADGGTSWTTDALTSSGKNIRPVAPRNADDGLRVMWMSGATGNYASYTSYDTGTSAAGE